MARYPLPVRLLARESLLVQVLAVRVPVRRTAEFLKALKQVVRGKPKAACVDAAVELARWLSAGRSRYPSTANCDRSS